MANETTGIGPAAPAAVAIAPELGNGAIWPLSVEQYHKMVVAGILDEDLPVELLEGWLVTKMGKNPRHRLAAELVREILAALLPAGWFVEGQEPLTTADSEPEPDASVVRGDRGDYLDRHPQPEEIALVVEVSDTSLRRDRALKGRIYANAGVPVYWIVNLNDGLVEVYTGPSGPTTAPVFADRSDYGVSDEVPVVIDGREIARVAVARMMPWLGR